MVSAGLLVSASRQDIRCTYRLCSVPKPGNKPDRLIFDMSPTTDAHRPPRFRLPTVREAIHHGPLAIRFDLRNGFWHVPLHVQARRWFGLRINGEYYTWTRLPMGWAWAPYFMQQVTKHVMLSIANGLDVHVSVYEDDVLCVGTEDVLLQMVSRLRWNGSPGRGCFTCGYLPIT